MRAFLFGGLLVVVGCSTSSPSSSADSGIPDGTEDGGADGGAPTCTTLDYTGAPVTPVAAAGGAPDAKGGAIADGIYHLTAYQAYNTTVPPDAPTLQGSIEITSGRYAIAFMTSLGEDRETGTYTTAGTMLTLQMVCPMTQTENARRYTVSGKNFLLYDVSDADAGATAPAEIATYTLVE